MGFRSDAFAVSFWLTTLVSRGTRGRKRKSHSWHMTESWQQAEIQVGIPESWKPGMMLRGEDIKTSSLPPPTSAPGHSGRCCFHTWIITLLSVKIIHPVMTIWQVDRLTINLLSSYLLLDTVLSAGSKWLPWKERNSSSRSLPIFLWEEPICCPKGVHFAATRVVLPKTV